MYRVPYQVDPQKVLIEVERILASPRRAGTSIEWVAGRSEGPASLLVLYRAQRAGLIGAWIDLAATASELDPVSSDPHLALRVVEELEEPARLFWVEDDWARGLVGADEEITWRGLHNAPSPPHRARPVPKPVRPPSVLSSNCSRSWIPLIPDETDN